MYAITKVLFGDVIADHRSSRYRPARVDAPKVHVEKRYDASCENFQKVNNDERKAVKSGNASR